MSEPIDQERRPLIPESLRAGGMLRAFGLAAGAFVVGAALVGLGYGAPGLVVCAVSLGIFTGSWLTWRSLDEAVGKPLDEIASRVEVLAARDVVALADAIANLEQGERPRPLVVQAAVVPVPAVPVLRRIAQAVNTTVLRLEGSAEQFNASTVEPCRRLFYVGPDDYLAGSACSEEMGSRLGQGGDVLVLTARFGHAGLELRRRGFESTLQERFPSLRVIAAFENNYDPRLTHDFIRSSLKTRPRLAGIYSTEGVGVRGAVEALVDAGLSGAVVVICHDFIDETMEYVKNGLMAGALTQDPFGQGHDTPIHLFNHVTVGWMPPESRLASRLEFVTSANYGRVARSPHRAGSTNGVAGPGDPGSSSPGGGLGGGTPGGGAGDGLGGGAGAADPASGLDESIAGGSDSDDGGNGGGREAQVKPLAISPKLVRIAVLGVADNPFWGSVREGVAAAERELKAFNGSVEWFVPEPDGTFDAAVRGREIERLVESGYDAIASPIYDLALVPYLNRAVDAGVAVATYNAEASSLQGLVATLSRQRRRLEMTATQLEISASQDPLTGARNRRLMDDDLVQLRLSVTESGQSAAIVMLDIDHFKAYNDAFGHGAGDFVLKQVAQCIQREIRPQDRLYRYGGEEFLVILRIPTMTGATLAAERITMAVEALRIPHEGNRPWRVVTISAGVAIVGGDDRPIAASVAEADAALYAAKESGRNRVRAAGPGMGGRRAVDHE